MNLPSLRQHITTSSADLEAASKMYLVAIRFLRSSSVALPFAMEVAERANLFAQGELRGKKVYAAAFSRNQEDVQNALNLLHYVRGWKGTQIFVLGRLVPVEMDSSFWIRDVLECYSESLSATDYRAHCFRVVDDIYHPVVSTDFVHSTFAINRQIVSRNGNYVFPCKLLLMRFRPQRNHPSSVVDQIQAEGVEKYCNMCPHFDPSNFSEINADASRTIDLEDSGL